MAKQGMRPEVKAQKLKNNKTANLDIKCKHCENNAVIFHGTHDKRVKVCYAHFVNPPQLVKAMSKETKMLAQLISMGLA